MKNYNKEDLTNYMSNDWIKHMMQGLNKDISERTDKWLWEIEPKRMIYADVYGDLLKVGGKKVLDVGGGYNSLTSVLARKNDYTLLDFCAHGGENALVNENIRWINSDWYKEDIDDVFDIVIANDIFPDVDQRLELFINKMIPICKELRLVITYYNKPVFYTAKRVDDMEILTFLSWDGEQTALVLNKYIDRMIDTSKNDIEYICHNTDSLYWNGRGVCSVSLKGNL